MNFKKYRPYPTMDMPNRRWPSQVITKAPTWCSVDLRDGNQSLEIPMSLEQKLKFFDFLVNMGFKQIEIGFPAASDTEFEFTRYLIEHHLIPDDVVIQVLTQSREHIIKKTFAALKGIKKAIVHLYNSTSTLQRDVVFHHSMEETIDLAVFGAKLMNEEKAKMPETEFIFEYSPESFTGTEMDYAAEICNAVIEVWKPTPDHKVIINLPSTVEMSTPNIYADQIEYMCDHLICRDSVVVSLHAHNDRGEAVAATELALMAGADRVEGTLFGNGERTGNADILTIAMNLFSQGIDPTLDFSHMNDIMEIYEKSTGLEVHPRHPYAGNLVYTAFSGSHQDAIRKGMERMKEHPDRWEVPYLPIDPMDVGRNYDPIIRINSQSGKGGVAFVLEQNYGLHLPKAFQQDLSIIVTKVSDRKHSDLTVPQIYDLFIENYVDVKTPIQLISYAETVVSDGDVFVSAQILYYDEKKEISGHGNGVVAAFCHALESMFNVSINIEDYREHSLSIGTKARAISYVQVISPDGKSFFGAGTSSNITKSSLRAVVSTVNRMIQ
ncbi:MAG: 2-isopropylmalate synthase [Clostridiales bacterium]|nr:2-isopropylmalate synthase [Clostridiales bacterium]